MYKIKIRYITGDSFGSEETYDCLEGSFENIETVTKNIERIKNHYKYYEKNSDMWHKPEGRLPEGVVWNDEFGVILLETIDDEGNALTESPAWVGYFETLLEVSVETDYPSWSPK